MEIPEPPDGRVSVRVGQLTWHWSRQLRPALDGLSDEEYLWEPVPDCWSIRPRGTESAPLALGVGDYVLEWAQPEPAAAEAPFTTIAWRLAHITVFVLGQRIVNHFGAPEDMFLGHRFPPTADQALVDLDVAYQRWIDGVVALGDEGLDEPVGESEGPFAAEPFTGLVQHINREVIHHGAEILLLRDLWRSRGPVSGQRRRQSSTGGPVAL